MLEFPLNKNLPAEMINMAHSLTIPFLFGAYFP